jgi:predicted TIM-barrel fold metal-dependent hydrolase
LIVDAYNNVWKPGGSSDYLTAEEYRAEMMLVAMNAAGVDMAVACSLGQMIDNQYVASVAAAHPDRIIGFGQVNARSTEAVRVVDSIGSDLKLRGLKLHPTMHGYHFADHGLLDPIFRACQGAGLVVLVNALDDPFCAPFAIEEIARGFPGVPVILSHMGTVWNVMEALIVAERNQNIYLETSSTQLLEVKMAYERLGATKILMGTDWPGSDFDLERQKIAKAVTSETDRALVEGGNLEALLGLSKPGSAS